jgi:hypothetical protein
MFIWQLAIVCCFVNIVFLPRTLYGFYRTKLPKIFADHWNRASLRRCCGGSYFTTKRGKLGGKVLHVLALGFGKIA